ncbi:hypothetical protein A0H81_14714 [Grifola frondosa]|uniref:Uncharacterized protein n=1 Tax=Grifola frondosa TaxID=5627 RepID=A0A1C7LM18_GRIFR|nr:hypothetical protein A0H81_14714 [Grifola frondosa]
MHRKDELFRFYRDGMLNYFEFLKWPQAYYPLEPHAAAAPGNPQLLTVGIENDKDLYRAFPLDDDEGILPKFADADIAWCGFVPRDFIVSEELSNATVGTLCSALLGRMKAALIETVKMAKDVFRIPQEYVRAEPQSAIDRRIRDYLYQRKRSFDLKRVYDLFTTFQ